MTMIAPVMLVISMIISTHSSRSNLCSEPRSRRSLYFDVTEDMIGSPGFLHESCFSIERSTSVGLARLGSEDSRVQ